MASAQWWVENGICWVHGPQCRGPHGGPPVFCLLRRVDSSQGVGTGRHILAGGMSELLWVDGCRGENGHQGKVMRNGNLITLCRNQQDGIACF